MKQKQTIKLMALILAGMITLGQVGLSAMAVENEQTSPVVENQNLSDSPDDPSLNISDNQTDSTPDSFENNDIIDENNNQTSSNQDNNQNIVPEQNQNPDQNPAIDNPDQVTDESQNANQNQNQDNTNSGDNSDTTTPDQNQDNTENSDTTTPDQNQDNTENTDTTTPDQNQDNTNPDENGSTTTPDQNQDGTQSPDQNPDNTSNSLGENTVYSLTSPINQSKANEDSTIFVELGTPIDSIGLPAQMTVKVGDSQSNENTNENPDTNNSNNILGDQIYAEKLIPITWECAEYNPNVDDVYTFTAVLPEDYVLAENVTLPTAYVVVGNPFTYSGEDVNFELTPAGLAQDVFNSSIQTLSLNDVSSGSYLYGEQLVTSLGRQAYQGFTSLTPPADGNLQTLFPLQGITLPVTLDVDTKYWSIDEKALSEFHKQVQDAYNAAVYDAPSLFWLREAVSSGPDADTAVINPTEKTATIYNINVKINSHYSNPAQFQSVVNSGISSARGSISGNTDAEIAKSIHDWICQQVSYNTPATSIGNSIFSPMDYSYAYEAYGVFQGKNVVCEGYSKAFKLLCEAYNIPCVLVIGSLQGTPHMWNYVQIDGNWYAVDVTNDDGSGTTYYDDLFLVGYNTTLPRYKNIPFSQFDVPMNIFINGGQEFTYPTLSPEKYVAPEYVDSQVTLDFDKDSYKYGDTINITATVSEAEKTRAATNSVSFYLGRESDDNFLGTEPVNNGKATLTYYTTADNDVTIPIGRSTIIAVYDGSSTMNGSFGEGSVTLDKGSITVEPTSLEVSYLYSDTGVKTIDLSSFVLTPPLENPNYSVGVVVDSNNILASSPSIQDKTLTLQLKGQDSHSDNSVTIPVVISSEKYEDVSVNIIIKLVDKTPVTVSGISVADKVYDKAPIVVTKAPVYTLVDQTTVTPTGTLTYTYTSTDGNNYSSTEAPTEAGTYQLTVSLDDPTYVLSVSEPIPFAIQQKEVTITGFKAPDHPYDGKTTVMLNHDDAVIQGVLDGDEVIAVYPENGTSASADVANNIAVTYEPITLSGDSARNYVITQQPVVTVNIVVAAPVVTFAKTEQSADYTGSVFAIEAPTITMSDGTTPPSVDALVYSYRAKDTTDWINGLPVEFGTYDVKATLPASTNFAEAVSNTITVTINQIAPPADSYTVPTGLSAVTNFQGILREIPLPENWTWKNPNEALSTSKSTYTAIYTPTNKNYTPIEVEVAIAVSSISVTYTDKDGKLVDTLTLKASTDAIINATVSGATDSITWTSSDSSIVTISGNSNSATISAKQNGVAVIGLSLDGKLLKPVVVKVSDNEDSAYTSGNINSIVDALKGKDPKGNKDLINKLADAIQEIPDSEKKKLTHDTIKNLDSLFISANDMTLEVEVVPSPIAATPITKVDIYGAGLASGQTQEPIYISLTQSPNPTIIPVSTTVLELDIDYQVGDKNVTKLTSPIHADVDMRYPTEIEKIIHHFGDGSTETIIPIQKDTTVSFQTLSFSTFSFIKKTSVDPTPTPTPNPKPDNGNNNGGNTIISGTTGGGSNSSSDYYYGSSSSSSRSSTSKTSATMAKAQSDFWREVENKIDDAEDGDTIKINAKYFDKMPISVMKALKGKDVTVIIQWKNGDDITINGTNLISWESQRLYYPLSKLLALYKDVPVKERIATPPAQELKQNNFAETTSEEDQATSTTSTANSNSNNNNSSSQTAYSGNNASGTSSGDSNSSKTNPETGTIIEIAAPAAAEIMPSIATPINSGFAEDLESTSTTDRSNLPMVIAGLAAVIAAGAVVALSIFKKSRN